MRRWEQRHHIQEQQGDESQQHGILLHQQYTEPVGALRWRQHKSIHQRLLHKCFNLLLDRVDVSVAVVQVAKLILGMELATSSVGSSSNHWSSINSGSSGIGDSGSSSNSGSSGIGDSGSSSIGNCGSSSISNGGKSRSLNSLNLNLGWSSHSIRIASMANGTSIAKTSIRIASIGQGGGQYLGLLSSAGSHQGRDYDKQLHGVHCCVMLNGVPMYSAH